MPTDDLDLDSGSIRQVFALSFFLFLRRLWFPTLFDKKKGSVAALRRRVTDPDERLWEPLARRCRKLHVLQTRNELRGLDEEHDIFGKLF